MVWWFNVIWINCDNIKKKRAFSTFIYCHLRHSFTIKGKSKYVKVLFVFQIL